jgi:hypothetical protein
MPGFTVERASVPHQVGSTETIPLAASQIQLQAVEKIRGTRDWPLSEFMWKGANNRPDIQQILKNGFVAHAMESGG